MTNLRETRKPTLAMIVAGAGILASVIGLALWAGPEQNETEPALPSTPLKALPAKESRRPEVAKSVDVQNAPNPTVPLPERAEDEMPQVQRQSPSPVATTPARPSGPPLQIMHTTPNERSSVGESTAKSPVPPQQDILNSSATTQTQTSESAAPQETPSLAFELAPGVVEPAAFYGDESAETPAQASAADAIAANLIKNVEEAAATGNDEILAATWDAEKEAADSNYRAIFGVSQYLLYSTEAAANALNSAK